jgi:hypothetical protein
VQKELTMRVVTVRCTPRDRAYGWTLVAAIPVAALLVAAGAGQGGGKTVLTGPPGSGLRSTVSTTWWVISACVAMLVGGLHAAQLLRSRVRRDDDVMTVQNTLRRVVVPVDDARWRVVRERRMVPVPLPGLRHVWPFGSRMWIGVVSDSRGRTIRAVALRRTSPDEVEAELAKLGVSSIVGD